MMMEQQMQQQMEQDQYMQGGMPMQNMEGHHQSNFDSVPTDEYKLPESFYVDIRMHDQSVSSSRFKSLEVKP